jgi:hypothetical protein
MNCPACGTPLAVVGRQLFRAADTIPHKDDSPEGVVKSIRRQIAVARTSGDPTLQLILDDLEWALSVLAR